MTRSLLEPKTKPCEHATELDGLPTHWGPRYVPLSLIGQGGFGRVYLCVDEQLHAGCGYSKEQSYVAIKAISLNGLSDEEIVLAMSEVSFLRSLDHPNILKYVDFFMDDVEEQLCLVTEYVDGCDISSLIRQHDSSTAEDPDSRATSFRHDSIPPWGRGSEGKAGSTTTTSISSTSSARRQEVSSASMFSSRAGAAWGGRGEGEGIPARGGGSWIDGDASFMPDTPPGSTFREGAHPPLLNEDVGLKTREKRGRETKRRGFGNEPMTMSLPSGSRRGGGGAPNPP
ncbi:unnamed protein product [Phytomonas sp. EM1]|nr:unnamed protein product [Phytomonas sp. EM1]|eukprot:CCW62986.1 unnamed protein product [Phytomonas sp. isolate EM1]